MKTIRTLTTILALGLAPAAALAENYVRGVIEDITTEPMRLTIAHEEIPNLDMESMTMVFRVADPAMLDGLSVGQEVEFEAARVNGRLTVTALRDPS